ncbi:MAG: endonuclease, partial [Planctomycetota bacterium]|nr:endonuclease [Planctomycetota bacterium]
MNSEIVHKRVFSTATSVTLLLCLPLVSFADPPDGYYDSVDATNSTTLRTTLNAVIDDHQRFPYTSGSTDTWDILNLADEDPNDAGNILDVYRNASYPKISGGTRDYNREHTWPKSYGFPDNTSDNYPYTDCHMLHLCDGGYNSSRSNNPYRDCHAGCSERTTLVNNGQGGGRGEYPGNSNWRTGSGSTGTWETWIGRRGDVARALFYADVRYEGGAPEPDLILTDDNSLIVTTGTNADVAYMGILSVLLQWHTEDPVDDAELNRNDVVFSFQDNRNPFIDHPEWVACLFMDECEAGCPQDLDGDGQVVAFDLAILLGRWGPCE